MTLLPSQFTSSGWTFRQIARAGAIALFEKSKPNISRPSYEVVIIQSHPPTEMFGRSYPAREKMPCSEQWGIAGWTHSDLPSAQSRFEDLANRHS